MTNSDKTTVIYLDFQTRRILRIEVSNLRSKIEHAETARRGRLTRLMGDQIRLDFNDPGYQGDMSKKYQRKRAYLPASLRPW